MISFFCQIIVLAENMGDHLYKQGAYFDAITEYKRILFFKVYGNREEILFGMAKTYYDLGMKRDTEDLLLRIIRTIKVNDLKTTALVLLAKIHWDSYHYSAMRAVLDQMTPELNPSGKQQTEYIRAWTFIYQANWEKGIEILTELNDPKFDLLVEDIRQVYEVPQKSILMARFLSKIIPGAGQLYAGDYENALYSFILVGSIGGSMIWDIYQKAYFTGIVKYFFLYTRYSKGSIYRMEAKIARNNVDRIGDFLRTVSDKYPKPLDVLEGIASKVYTRKD